jgi:hypothetical protein
MMDKTKDSDWWQVFDIPSGNLIGEFRTLAEAKSVAEGYNGYVIYQGLGVTTRVGFIADYTEPGDQA